MKDLIILESTVDPNSYNIIVLRHDGKRYEDLSVSGSMYDYPHEGTWRDGEEVAQELGVDPEEIVSI